MEHLKYPIGKYQENTAFTQHQIRDAIEELMIFPETLKKTVCNLSDNELAKTYREGSWTIKQLVHHIGESHTNAYIRIKLALTEENPTIKPYDENLWVNTKENEILPISVSLQLIEAIHLRLATLLQTLTEKELARTFFHPQSKQTWRISDIISMYSWHGKHHLAHIRLALDKK